MSDKDFEDAFSDDPIEEAEPTEEVETAPEPEAQDEPQPDEPDEPQEPVEVEAKPEVAEQPSDDGDKIPVNEFKGYLDEREKRQQLEAETARLKAQLEQFQQSQRKEETPTPDIYEDPDGYRKHVEQSFEQRMLVERVSTSEFLARDKFGDEMVDKVKAWAQALPDERAAQLTKHPAPYFAAVEAYKQEQATSVLKTHDYDIEKLVEARLAERLQEQPTTDQQPAQKLPPKVANAGGAQTKPVTQGEGDFFVSVFES